MAHFSALSSILLLSLVRPLGARVCNVRDYGARGDNATEDTLAIQRALDACSPGVTVLPAPGLYLSRALNLAGKSDIEVRIAAGATLMLWPHVDSWNASGVFMDLLSNAVFHPAAGDVVAQRQVAITTNITITGGGVIDGQG